MVEGPDGDDAIAVHHVGFLSLAWDHRAFDGAYAASFLERAARRAGDARLGSRARCDDPVGRAHAGSARFRTPRPRRCSARCTSTPTPTTCCCRNIRTCTRSARARRLEHVLRDPASVGAELVKADRGGDVTYHGPGQLVGYPIISLAEWKAGQRDVVAYVRKLEDVLIAVCADFGISAGRSERLHRSVGRRREDRRDRRARLAGPDPPRVRAERRSRPLDVRAHRAVRHPRSRRHVDGAAPRPPGGDAGGRRQRRRPLRRSRSAWSTRRSPGRRVAAAGRGRQTP